MEERHAERARAAGREFQPSFEAEILHFFGKVEVVFGLWAVVLLAAIGRYYGWAAAQDYLGHGVNYTEALFVVVIMTGLDTPDPGARRGSAAPGGRDGSGDAGCLVADDPDRQPAARLRDHRAGDDDDRRAGCPVVFLTVLTEPEVREHALAAGGCAFLSKASAGDELVPAVRAVMALRPDRTMNQERERRRHE